MKDIRVFGVYRLECLSKTIKYKKFHNLDMRNNLSKQEKHPQKNPNYDRDKGFPNRVFSFYHLNPSRNEQETNNANRNIG